MQFGACGRRQGKGERPANARGPETGPQPSPARFAQRFRSVCPPFGLFRLPSSPPINRPVQNPAQTESPCPQRTKLIGDCFRQAAALRREAQGDSGAMAYPRYTAPGSQRRWRTLRGFRAGAPDARRKEISGPPRILHTQGSAISAATRQMACLRENRTEACRHRCVAWSSKPMCGSDVTGRFDSCTLPPALTKMPISNDRHFLFQAACR